MKSFRLNDALLRAHFGYFRLWDVFTGCTYAPPLCSLSLP
jgi:hypothetical protein